MAKKAEEVRPGTVGVCRHCAKPIVYSTIRYAKECRWIHGNSGAVFCSFDKAEP